MREVPNNIDMTIGNLGLTDREENLIVTVLQTLTDGFTTPYPNSRVMSSSCLPLTRFRPAPGNLGGRASAGFGILFNRAKRSMATQSGRAGETWTDGGPVRSRGRPIT
jgi:hypothetical protein